MNRTLAPESLSIAALPPCRDYPFLQPPADSTELGRLLHYRVRRKFGEGGMGMVFAAEDTDLRRLVALKVIHPRMAGDAKARERFLRETRAMAALADDRAVTVFQVGIASGPDGGDVPFLAMQYLEGATLEGALKERERLPWAEAARICPRFSTTRRR